VAVSWRREAGCVSTKHRTASMIANTVRCARFECGCERCAYKNVHALDIAMSTRYIYEDMLKSPKLSKMLYWESSYESERPLIESLCCSRTRRVPDAHAQCEIRSPSVPPGSWSSPSFHRFIAQSPVVMMARC
jgi:hypothetical protein